MLKGVDEKTARIYCLRGETGDNNSEVPQRLAGPYAIEDLFQQWLTNKIITQAEYDEAQRALNLFADHIRALATA